MERLKGFLKNNIPLKIVSVAIAFILWLIAYNVSNPEVTDSVAVPLEVRHEYELTGINKTYSIDVSTVRVNYKIRSQDRKKVSASNFDVYVDLSDYSLTGAVPIYYEADSTVLGSISSISISPIIAHIEIEDMVEKDFDIYVSLNGTQADEKELGETVLSSDTVTLYGPVSDIGRIARVTTEISIDGAEETVSGTAELEFHDSGDNVISLGAETVVRDTITYTVPVYSTKRLSISASYTGVPAAGYTLNSFTVEPSYLTVYGPDEILEQYSVITIPEDQVNISGATANIAQLIDGTAYVPEGLWLSGSGDISIVASIGRSSMPAVIPSGGNAGNPSRNPDTTETGAAETEAPSEQEESEDGQEEETAGTDETDEADEADAMESDDAEIEVIVIQPSEDEIAQYGPELESSYQVEQ